MPVREVMFEVAETTPENLRLAGAFQDDVLSGGAAHDLLTGGRGHDELRGGHGDDRYVGGPGQDLFSSPGRKEAKSGSRTSPRTRIGSRTVSGRFEPGHPHPRRMVIHPDFRPCPSHSNRPLRRLASAREDGIGWASPKIQWKNQIWGPASVESPGMLVGGHAGP